MCIILDANRFGRFNKRDKGKQDKDMEPIWDWLDGEYGKIVYSDTKDFRREWFMGGMKKKMRTLNRTGKLKLVPVQEVLEKQNELEGQIKSNDLPTLALAIVARVKVLVSDDKALNAHFRSLIGGAVYQTEADSFLLQKDTCP